MSVRVYSVAPELDGSSGSKLKAGRIKVTFAAFRNGRRVHKNSELSIVGTSDANLLSNMVSAVEALETMSQGKVVSIEMEMGHYRYDEQLPELAGEAAAAVCYAKTIDGKNMKVYVPFTRDTLSPAAIMSAINDLCATDETTTDAQLGFVRWNGEKTALITDQALIAFKASTGLSEQTGIAPKPVYTDAPGLADYHVGAGA